MLGAQTDMQTTIECVCPPICPTVYHERLGLKYVYPSVYEGSCFSSAGLFVQMVKAFSQIHYERPVLSLILSFNFIICANMIQIDPNLGQIC